MPTDQDYPRVPQLTSERILLRPFEDSELGLLVKWRNEPCNWNYFFNKIPLQESSQKQFLAKLKEDQRRILFAICTTSNAPIGCVGLSDIDPLNQRAELWNVLVGEADYRGTGIGTESLRLLLKFAFDHLNMNRVYLHVFADNVEAIRAYERVGFKTEGLLRENVFSGGQFHDITVMGVLRREMKQEA